MKYRWLLKAILVSFFWMGCSPPTTNQETPVTSEEKATENDVDAGSKQGPELSTEKEATPEQNETPELVPEAPKPITHQTQKCTQEGIERLSLPFYYDRKDSPRFVYHYLRRKNASPDATTIIILPGGPGQRNIQVDRIQSPIGSIPLFQFHQIQTDLRGAGCNTKREEHFPHDFFQSRYAARDILAIIKDLETKQKKPLRYILYGGSYGALHATIVTSLAEKEGITPPQAVVLEGVPGVMPSFEQHVKNYQKQWNDLKATLPEEWKKKFDTNQLPYGSTKAWGHFVFQMLIQGSIPNQGNPIHSYFGPFSVNRLKSIIGQMEQQAKAVETGRLPLAFTVIACREMWGSFRQIKEVKDGNYNSYGPDICEQEKIKPLTQHYDPKDWPINKTPIVYFQGTRDPATPLSGARYHFESQTKALRYFVTVQNVAHPVLTMALRFKVCSVPIWKAIDKLQQDPKQLEAALKICKYEKDYTTSLEIQQPKP